MISDALLDAIKTAKPANAANLRAVAAYMDGQWPTVLTPEMRASLPDLAAKLWALADWLESHENDALEARMHV